jgi:phosphotransferase system IIA component
MSNVGMVNWVFQNNASAIGNGNEMWVHVGATTANIEITGTGISTCIFEGRSIDDGNWYSIIGVNLSDLSMASSTTSKGVLYQCDLIGLIQFRVRISSYTSGTVTVKGRVVN